MKRCQHLGKKLLSLILVVMIVFSAMTIGITAVSAANETKTIYFSSNGYWSKLFAVFVWGDAYDNGEWYTLNEVSGKGDLYRADIPVDYNNVIFCSREVPAQNWDYVENRTAALSIPDGKNYLTLTGDSTAVWDTYTETDIEASKTIYFVPNAEWSDIQYNSAHEYVLHAYNSEDAQGVWETMALVDGSFGGYPSTWSAEIDTDYTTVEFCRVEFIDENTYTVWEKTNAQTIPENKNLFTQNDVCATGVWSYTEEIVPTEPVVTEPATESETITEATQPAEDDAETKIIYFTPNETWSETVSMSIGRVSAYAYNSATGEGKWYWLESTDSVDADYYLNINADYDTIYFGVSYSGEPDGVWNQTDEQTIPENSNHFIQDSDDEAIGTWGFIDTEDKPESIVSYYVVFVDYDGTLISAQVVNEGSAAKAPADPVRKGYTFLGWDKAFGTVTENLTVTARYSKDEDVTPPVVSTTGRLQIEVAGGTSFTISVNGGVARPQGTSYLNTKAPRNTTVTVISSASNGNEFMGWINESGAIVSTSESFTFTTSGNDYFKAMYQTNVEGVNLVVFKNDRAAGGNGQILDMQYYTAGDDITAPDTPTLAGYVFAGWDKTPSQAKAEIAKGNDVTVLANWTRAIVYVTVTAEGGAVEGATADNKYAAYGAVTVKADTPADGMKFAYWTNAEGKVVSYDAEYKFYPAADTYLKANFVAENAEIEYQAIASLAADPTTQGEKITYTMSWNVPEAVGEFKLAGLMVVDAEDYNADTFYHGSGDSKLFDRALSGSMLIPKNTYGITKGASYYGHTYYACTWVQYVDANGETVTVYSDMIAVEKLAE